MHDLIDLVLGGSGGQVLGARQLAREFFALHNAMSLNPQRADSVELKLQTIENRGVVLHARLVTALGHRLHHLAWEAKR